MAYSKSQVFDVFREKYGVPEMYLFAPGRANIIGEHTDYTLGYVLPFATQQGVHFWVKKTETREFEVFALDTCEEIRFLVSDIKDDTQKLWQTYLHHSFQQLGLKDVSFGLSVVFGGDLPIGAGMSSSSALTCGFLFLLNHVYSCGFDVNELVRLAVKAEHGSGVLGGMMDQYSILSGKKDYALLLDCESACHEYIPVQTEPFAFYLINTNVKHQLVDSPYNTRRKQSEEALQIIRQTTNQPELLYKNIENDAVPDGLEDPVLIKRARHIIFENKRTLQMTQFLKTKNFVACGQLLIQSHESLSKDYEVSCEELDFLVTLASGQDGWAGGRMMGGGFGGCTINLMKTDQAEKIFETLSESYFKKFGITPDLLKVEPSDGVFLSRFV